MYNWCQLVCCCSTEHVCTVPVSGDVNIWRDFVSFSFYLNSHKTVAEVAALFWTFHLFCSRPQRFWQDNPVIPFIMFTYALLPRKVYFINFVTLYTGKFSLCVVSWSSPVQQWQWCDHRPVPEVQWLSVLTLPCPAAFLLNCYDKTPLLLHFNTGRNFCFSSFVFHWRYIINCSCCNERTHRQICWKYVT